MSEIIEITEDNCVLDDFEMQIIDDIFVSTLETNIFPGNRKIGKRIFDRIFLKINKLNDLAKDANV